VLSEAGYERAGYAVTGLTLLLGLMVKVVGVKKVFIMLRRFCCCERGVVEGRRLGGGPNVVVEMGEIRRRNEQRARANSVSIPINTPAATN
jgi:hypothetical protein